MFTPKVITTLGSYDRRQFTADLGAGVTVGVVAIPLAIAFAIASGLTPAQGLWTAIVAGFLTSALGGSRVQIGGPTGAFVVLVHATVQQHGVDGMIAATFMAGVILVFMGLARLGTLVRHIPAPVITGFTAGIAVLILRTQLASLESIGAASLAAVCIAGLVLWPKVSTRVPAPFAVLLAATLGAQLLSLPVETIGSRYGALSGAIPRPHLPLLSSATLVALLVPAISIALLGAIESLLSAVVADAMIGTRHRSNIELVAQGLANVGAALFGGMPATGAIARTATNVNSGGRTPVAGMVHAATILIITLFFGRWASLIPLPALGAILIMVAYHMSHWRAVRAQALAPGSGRAVLLATLVLTVLVDLIVAIGTGLALALVLRWLGSRRGVS